MKCRICNTDSDHLFKARILNNKYEVSYFQCRNCHFLQTEDPYWLEEAYSAVINFTDTGIIKRNLMLSKIVSGIIFVCFDRKRKMLDYGGGHGIFTRIMRDIGYDFYWLDKYAENIYARGFELPSGEKVEVVTAFEVFEHLINPLKDIEEMLKNGESIIFSTEVLAKKVPEPDKWWYYGLEHGQHIAFYSKHTLQFIAQKYNMNIYSKKGIHLLTSKKISSFRFKIILIMSLLGMARIINMFMKSKTWKDYLYLKNL